MQAEKFKEVLRQNGIEIRTQGQNEYILCPFHPDKNPSLIINNYNTYCFACNKKYSFYDVLRQYGIKVEKPVDNPEALKHIKLNQILEDYATKSHSRLVELINSPKYSYIKNYLLKERKVSKEVLEQIEDIGVLVKDTQTIEHLEEYKKEYPDQSDNIDKLIKLLSTPDEDVIVFFYRNTNFNITSIKFRNPRLEKRKQFKFWKKGKKTGIFGIKNINTKDKKLLGVEGEFNLFAVKSALPDTNIIAVGSANADFETIKNLVIRFGFEFYYAYDNDEAGFKTVWQLKEYIPAFAFTTTYYNDLDEAYKKLGKKDFIEYLQKELCNVRLFTKNTKQWNDTFYNCENFVIEDDTLYYIKEDTKTKISTTPFLIKEIINKYGVEYLVLVDKFGKTYSFPKELLLNTKKVINLTKEGFNFTTSESKYITKFVSQLLDENVYPVSYINTVELDKNGFLKGDVVLSKQGQIIKEIISFKNDGIWHIKYEDDFIERKLSGYRIINIDVYEHLLTGKKIYEFEYDNLFESYKDNFKSISDFAKKISIDKKQYPKLTLALSNALNKLKTTPVEKRLPDIKYGFYLSEGRILYAGNWQTDTQSIEYLPQAVENLKQFINLFKDKRKSLAVLYSVINSAFAFVRKQLSIEAMIPILAGKGLTGKTTIVEHLLKMYEVYREKSGQSINSYRRLAETVNENGIPVLINECENVLRNQALVDVLKNIGGQDFIAHSDAKKEITFIAYSGLILTTNRIPQTLDTALISRLVPVIYTAEDVIIDKVKFETDSSYKNQILERKRQLQKLSDSFHIIGKAFIQYVLNNSDEILETLKMQARDANSYVETGRQLLLNFLSKFQIDTSFFTLSQCDIIEEITSTEEEDTETRIISDIAKKIREANRLIDSFTRERLQITISVEEKIRQLIFENNTRDLKEILSIVLPDYLIVSTRSDKVVLRKIVMDRLKISLSGGFRALCSQLGFKYASRYGERVGIMDFDTFMNLLKQALMCEGDDEALQIILSNVSFPLFIDDKVFNSKAEFIKFYYSLTDEGKLEIYSKLITSV